MVHAAAYVRGGMAPVAGVAVAVVEDVLVYIILCFPLVESHTLYTDRTVYDTRSAKKRLVAWITMM